MIEAAGVGGCGRRKILLISKLFINLRQEIFQLLSETRSGFTLNSSGSGVLEAGIYERLERTFEASLC